MFFTSEVCSVSPFLSDYGVQDDVQICTAATAFDTSDGETIILVFGQGLWFGERMDRTLINPNQCRHFGIQICDDPMDPHRELGITMDDEYFIPMSMDGTTCGFVSRCPTVEELESSRTFILSDEQHWDPHHVSFDNGNGDKSQISSVNSQYLSYNSFGTHDYDNVMAQISPIYNQELLLERLIASVNANKSSTGATYSNKRHHGTDPNLLAQKWGIGVQKARDTLKCTTQMNIRSAILPLTRRYRTDLLSQRLKRLSTRFYTDTIYAKHKSLQGHTCAQIFTDGEGFVVAFPIRTKEDAGEALQKNCRDVGVPDQLHYDNANEMVGPNTKF